MIQNPTQPQYLAWRSITPSEPNLEKFKYRTDILTSHFMMPRDKCIARSYKRWRRYVFVCSAIRWSVQQKNFTVSFPWQLTVNQYHCSEHKLSPSLSTVIGSPIVFFYEVYHSRSPTNYVKSLITCHPGPTTSSKWSYSHPMRILSRHVSIIASLVWTTSHLISYTTKSSLLSEGVCPRLLLIMITTAYFISYCVGIYI